ncbi:hypothetical protein Vretimale_16054, partial [Volvox reticuliferus]
MAPQLQRCAGMFSTGMARRHGALPVFTSAPSRPGRPRLMPGMPTSRPGVRLSPPSSVTADLNGGPSTLPTAAQSISTMPPTPLSTVDITDKLGSTNPLIQALNSSRTSLYEAQRVREALEAEAQEVAQLAVGAAEAKNKAKAEVFAMVSQIEEATRQQQAWVDKVTSLRQSKEALDAQKPAAESGPEVDEFNTASNALLSELSEAEARAAEVSNSIMALRVTMEELYAKAVMAEAAAAKAEEVAAAAMKAAEAAVKDEMHAAAVVKETQTALEKTLSALKDLGNKNAAADSSA